MPISPADFAAHHKAQYPFHEIFHKMDEQLKRGPRGELKTADVFLDRLPDWVADAVCIAYEKAGWSKVSYEQTGDQRDSSTHFELTA